MCKTWSIKYSCSHTCRFRLSTCRGTFTTQARPDKQPKASCSTSPVLAFCASSKCGLCERARSEEQEAEKVNSIRTKVMLKSRARYEDELDFEEDVVPADNAELMAAIEQQQYMSFRAYKLFPNQDSKKFPVPERGRRMTSKPESRLKHEVMPADVVDAKADAKTTDSIDEDQAYYNNWNSWTVSDDRVVEIAQVCKAWMEDDNESVEPDSTVQEWSFDMDKDTTATLSPVELNPMESFTSTEDMHDVLTSEFDVKEPQPYNVNPTISTVLSTSTSSKLNISPPPTQLRTGTNGIDKENTSPSSYPTTTIPNPPDHQNENPHPPIRYKLKAVPPHLRRRKSCIFNRQRSSSEPVNVRGKAEADLAENSRCKNYSWVSVST